MLTLTRNLMEAVCIGDNIFITIAEVNLRGVKLNILKPADVEVYIGDTRYSLTEKNNSLFLNKDDEMTIGRTKVIMVNPRLSKHYVKCELKFEAPSDVTIDRYEIRYPGRTNPLEEQV